VLSKPVGGHTLATVELTAVERERQAVIVLGASNVSRGLARLVATVRSRAELPADLFVAAGHGRAYGVNSRVWMRRLPSILACGLWRSLAENASAGKASPVAVVTDVGNELLYGLGVAQVAGAVRETVRRLADRGVTIAITGLPLASIGSVGPVRYRALRTAFVPGCRLPLPVLKDAAAWLDDELRAIATAAGAVFIAQPADWYGLDAIHVRRRSIGRLWREVADAWNWPTATRPPRGSVREWAAIGSRAAETRSLARVMLHTPQPAWRSRDGLRLWLY
jgi:hypothetical protein